MGLIRCHVFSEVLQTHTMLTVTVPDILKMPIGERLRGNNLLFPVIYVLHGGTEESTLWVRKTRIEEYGQQYGFISVSIDGMSSCYSDMVHGYKFFTYLTEELPEIMEAYFPASPCWEDRYIAGFSMGGQGTLKAAFRCPEKYAAAMALSGARDIVALFEIWEKMEHGPDLTAAYNALGPVSKLRGSENDLMYLAKIASQRQGRKPKLLIACATNDYAAALTEEYHQLLDALHMEHTYFQAPGIHNYYFVDHALHWALQNWVTLREPQCKEEERVCI